jgi:hypothetical protein
MRERLLEIGGRLVVFKLVVLRLEKRVKYWVLQLEKYPTGAWLEKKSKVLHRERQDFLFRNLFAIFCNWTLDPTPCLLFCFYAFHLISSCRQVLYLKFDIRATFSI